MSSGRPTKSKVNPLVQTNTVWAFAELEEYNNALMQSVAAHSCQHIECYNLQDMVDGHPAGQGLCLQILF